MLRRFASSTIAVAALVAGLATVPAAPASADHDPVEGLTVHPEWGSVTGTSGVLRRGCHGYDFRYSIDPPEGDWVLEVFITGPGRLHVTSGAYFSGSDPLTGTDRFKLCRASTRPGTFTIQAKLSVDNGAPGYVEGQLPPSTFKLRKQRRHR